MKQIILAALLFQWVYAPAQSIIKGKATDEDKKGIGNVTVNLISGNKLKTVLSGPDGNFLFEKVEAGTHQLTLSATDFDIYELKVSVKENETLDLGILNLVKYSIFLQSIEVIGVKSKKYNSDYSFSGTKTASLNKEIPQAVSSVTKELIADRQAFQLGDAVKIVSGVTASSFYNFYSIRGFSQNEEGQIINGMRTRQYFFIQPLTSNVERVEVIKGNASATFSSVDPGGSINLVTKKPLAEERKEISVSAGSFSTMRSTLDFTGPLNKDQTLLYRLNAAYQEAKSFRDLVHQKTLLLSPSFTYVPNDKTSVNVEFIYNNMDGKLDRGQPIFGAVAGVTDLHSTPSSLNLCAPNDYYKSGQVIVMGSIIHNFNEHISLNVSYMKQTWNEDLLEHRTTNQFAVDTNNKPIPTLAAMQAVVREQFWNVDNVNGYLNIHINTGKVKHKIVTGYDLNSWQKLSGGQNAARGYLLNDGTATNTFVPANAANYQTITMDGIVMPKPNVDHFDLADPENKIRNISKYVFASQSAFPAQLTVTHAIYLQEQLYWKKFMLLLSLRNEWYRDVTDYKTNKAVTVNQTALLPRAGLTYSVTKNINVYCTFLQGYQPQSNTVTLLPIVAPAGSTYDPLESDLKEVGIKSNFFNEKLQVNCAAYEINERNLLMSANSPDNPDSLVLRGEERGRGFEIDIAGFILPNWQVAASYTNIDARILNDNDPTLVGARKQNTPVNSANLWTRYDFSQRTVLKNLGLGLGLHYNDSKIPWLTRDFETPAYTLLDMALYYTPNKSNMQLAVNVNNVTDETYWSGAFNYLRLFPGAPRNFMFTATYKF